MSQTHIVSVAMKIHHLTNLNTYLIDKNGEFIFFQNFVTIPSFMPGAHNEDVFYFHQQIKQKYNKTYSFINDWGLHYLGYSFSSDQEVTIIIGPFMTLMPDLFNLTREYNLRSY